MASGAGSTQIEGILNNSELDIVLHLEIIVSIAIFMMFPNSSLFVYLTNFA